MNSLKSAFFIGVFTATSLAGVSLDELVNDIGTIHNQTASLPGSITVFTGCMYSGKSSRLIEAINKARYAVKEPSSENILVVMSSICHNPDEELIISRNGTNVTATKLAPEDTDKIYDLAKDKQIVAVDEAQFFTKELVDIMQRLATEGKTVFIAGLDQDFMGSGFGPMPELMVIADKVKKLSAVCEFCRQPACMSARLVDGQVVGAESPQVMASCTAKVSYHAACRKCHLNSLKN